ncbi:MAG: gamma-glutamyl-gamma-aminobutyrate hydrolase family protein [Betaproteobacteria bacterium]
MPAPFVLIPCDNRLLGQQYFHVLGRKYADALHDAAGGLPLLVPTGSRADIDAYLQLADGILLTGSPANVHPSHFGERVRDPALPLDPERDAVTLPLVHRAIERGIPLLAVCRGLQEINVALGGSLHQALHEAGFADHRENPKQLLDEQYGPAHEVEATAGGMLEGITGTRRFTVNSLHGQGIARLAEGLAVEATSPDGVIEAVRLTQHPGFALALQCHPEWKATQNPLSTKIFGAFGAACRAFAQAPLARAA